MWTTVLRDVVSCHVKLQNWVRDSWREEINLNFEREVLLHVLDHQNEERQLDGKSLVGIGRTRNVRHTVEQRFTALISFIVGQKHRSTHRQLVLVSPLCRSFTYQSMGDLFAHFTVVYRQTDIRVYRSCDRMSSVRLSVCLSVTLVDCDHIGLGWNSSFEIISPLVSLRCSLSADPNIKGLLQGEHPIIFAQSDPPPVDLSIGDIWSQIAAEWLQIAQRSQWRAYRKPPSLFRMVPLLTPYDLPSPQMGVPYAPMIREWPYLRNGSFDSFI